MGMGIEYLFNCKGSEPKGEEALAIDLFFLLSNTKSVVISQETHANDQRGTFFLSG